MAILQRGDSDVLVLFDVLHDSLIKTQVEIPPEIPANVLLAGGWRRRHRLCGSRDGVLRWLDRRLRKTMPPSALRFLPVGG